MSFSKKQPKLKKRKKAKAGTKNHLGQLE